jgi:hypothetical protein
MIMANVYAKREIIGDIGHFDAEDVRMKCTKSEETSCVRVVAAGSTSDAVPQIR